MTRRRRRATSPGLLRSARLRAGVEPAGYPLDLPAVRGIERLHFAPLTFLVGDNGSGKSTLVEGLAVAAGFNPEGGSRNLLFETYPTHSALGEHLLLEWTRRPSWGWFLRAETFYGMASHIDRDEDLRSRFPSLHMESHGESFLDLALARFLEPGFYVLDEPEAALSFHGQLKLLRVIHLSLARGSQFIVATHSPVLMAYPDAAIYELTEAGPELVRFNDVEAVQLWRDFLAEPAVFFDELLREEP